MKTYKTPEFLMYMVVFITIIVGLRMEFILNRIFSVDDGTQALIGLLSIPSYILLSHAVYSWTERDYKN